MQKLVVFFIAICMLCISMSGAGAFELKNNQKEIIVEEKTITNTEIDQNLAQTFSKYLPTEQEKKEIEIPWIKTNTGLLEWNVRIEYNGETFQKQVPVNINDFREKFLKHPEYGEHIFFDVDNDPEYDIEVIVGFYWSVIKDANGNDVKSLEKRFRVRQLETGGYVDDSDGEMEVWSELHVNYGLIKQSSSSSNVESNLSQKNSFYKTQNTIFSGLFENFFSKIRAFFEKIFNLLNFREDEEPDREPTDEDDSDYISVGAGYRSPDGEDIPRYTEKRFAFARENIFSPTIFQHQMDPGSSKGKGPFELLYGFRSFNSGASNPSYDIDFSVEFDPAVYLRTKFIPIGGYVYYYFEDDSQRNQPTTVTFAADFNKKSSSNEEGIELSLVFDKIDNSLGRTGRWMSFDIDAVDFDVLSGKFHYKASHSFSVGVVVNSPSFLEKVEIVNIPDRVDVSWDVDFVLNPSSMLYAHADGFIDLDMSSDLGGVNVYYPKSDPSASDEIFIDVPGGIPKSSRVEAGVTLNVDLNNLENPSNYVYGMLKHTCSSNVDSIRAFLPEEETPIVKVTDIPAYSEAKGKLKWNTLEGYAYAWRGSSGPPDPVELNLDYKGFHIHDILTIRNGHIDTRFKVAKDGHFYFDTSEGMFGNALQVSNSDSGDSLGLFVDEVSADELQADWNLDTSGSQLKIQQLKFGGLIDTMKGLEINLDYQGKTVDAELDWVLAQTGYFDIQVNQQADLTLDFSQFAQNSTVFDIDGGITLSQTLQFDMSWKLQQGEKEGGNVDPGYFTINENVDEANIKSFDFYITYQDQYGVNVEFDNLQFYLDLEWWKGDRLLPYVWLDYEVSVDDFDVDLLWTNRNGETQWYYNVEDGF